MSPNRANQAIPERAAQGEKMRVIVCGGRNYTDARAIYAAIDLLRPEVVISGCQTGADTIALNGPASAELKPRSILTWWTLAIRAGPSATSKCWRKANPIWCWRFPVGAARPTWYGGPRKLGSAGCAQRLGRGRRARCGCPAAAAGR